MVRHKISTKQEPIMNIQNNKRKEQLWSAIAHLRPNPGNDMLQGAPGAFVAVIVLAVNAHEVFVKVKNKATSYEFMLGRIEEIEPLSAESSKTVSHELLKLGESITPENPVGFGSFHAYKQKPEENK